MTIRLLTMYAVVALALAFAPPAPAQQAPQLRLEQAATFGDDELKSFAVAAVQVQRINDTYLPKAQAATSIEEQKEVENTAAAEMVRAVEKEGMTVDRFQEILSHARANPEVAERVRQHLLQSQ